MCWSMPGRRPRIIPCATARVPALETLRTWLKTHLKRPSPAVSAFVCACRVELEELTAAMPQPPADHRRDDTIKCKCKDCAEIKKFLRDPEAPTYRFSAAEPRRKHVASYIREGDCDLSFKTEKKGSPHTLVCTKTDASYRERLRTYHEDLERLGTVRDRGQPAGAGITRGHAR